MHRQCRLLQPEKTVHCLRVGTTISQSETNKINSYVSWLHSSLANFLHMEMLQNKNLKCCYNNKQREQKRKGEGGSQKKLRAYVSWKSIFPT